MTTMLELLRQLGLVVCTIALMLCVAGLGAPAWNIYVLAGIGGWAVAQYDSGYKTNEGELHGQAEDTC